MPEVMMRDEGTDCSLCGDEDFKHLELGGCTVSGCDCTGFEEEEDDEDE